MKKYSIFLLPVVMIFFLSNNYQQKKNYIPVPEGISKWTGTVTYEAIITYSNAAYNGKVEIHGKATFTDALPTLYRDDGIDDLNFTDDKGYGSHQVHSEVTDIVKKKCVGDCGGNGQAELHAVVINEFENTYEFEVLFPDCVGNGNCVENGVYKADPLSANVSNHPLTNKNVLAGSKTESGQLVAGLGTFTRTITWHLVRSPGVVELIVTPEEYETWLPEPGKDEMTKGSVMGIDLKLQNSNGGPPTLKAISFELKLEGTSTEPGITINAPLNPVNNLPDIRFLPQPNGRPSPDFQKLVINCNKCTSASASVAAYDGGGWTTLTVKATLEDNSVIEGVLISSGGPKKIPIPERSPGSHIASLWLAENNNPQETDDIESSTGNTNYGDGLSAYEEYRGVISEGKFNRLDPMKKEVGVKIKKTEIPLFADGISKFETVSDLKVIRFLENEIGTDRKLNKNFKTAKVYLQYALNLVNGSCSPNAVGQNEPLLVNDKIPQMSVRVVVDIAKIKRYHLYNRTHQLTMPYTESEEIASVTAHELGHGVHISHHGYFTPRLDITVIYPQPKVTIINVRGDTIKVRPYKLTGWSGQPENDASGNCDCIMTYNNVYSWAMTGPPGRVLCKGVPDLGAGKILCTTQNGTQINATPYYFGNATGSFGKCLTKIKLKP